MEDMELSSEEGLNGGEETDPSFGFSSTPFLSCEEVYPESGFCLEGEKLKLASFLEVGLGMVRALVGGKDLRLRKRVSRWEGRTELVIPEQLMAETCSKTHASWACEMISSTADSLSVSEKS